VGGLELAGPLMILEEDATVVDRDATVVDRDATVVDRDAGCNDEKGFLPLVIMVVLELATLLAITEEDTVGTTADGLD